MSVRKNRLGEAVQTHTHNLCFKQKYEEYQNFLSENFHFFFFSSSSSSFSFFFFFFFWW